MTGDTLTSNIPKRTKHILQKQFTH